MTQGKKLITCRVCHHDKCREGDIFCCQCGHKLSVRSSTPLTTKICRTEGFLSVCLLIILCYLSTVARVAAHGDGHSGHHHGESSNLEDPCSGSDQPDKCYAQQYGQNANLFHKVGKIFNEEKQRQRRENHNTADAVENGPKEISMYWPSDPQIRIVDLDDAERDRDICLVLNIAAPEVNSRLVIFCNSEAEFANTRNSTNDSEDT